MIENMQIPVQMYTDALTQPIIAPVQETLTAKQAYGVGAYFIYRSKLYTTTAAISQGAAIVLEGSGVNATPGGTVMEKHVAYPPSIGSLITSIDAEYSASGISYTPQVDCFVQYTLRAKSTTTSQIMLNTVQIGGCNNPAETGEAILNGYAIVKKGTVITSRTGYTNISASINVYNLV